MNNNKTIFPANTLLPDPNNLGIPIIEGVRMFYDSSSNKWITGQEKEGVEVFTIFESKKESQEFFDQSAKRYIKQHEQQ